MRLSFLVVIGTACGRIDFDPVEPVFDLDFTRSPAAGFRVERASAGTFVGPDGLLHVAGPDEPRFDHDPVTREPRGLLIESESTNLTDDSEDLAGNWFEDGNVAIMVDRTRAPDGTLTADEVIDQDIAVQARRAHGIDITSSDLVYTFSVFVRASTITVCTLGAELLDGSSQNQQGMDVDLATGAILRTPPASIAHGVIPYPDGWYRLWMTIQDTASGNQVAILSVWSDLTDVSRTGSLFVWGSQIEQGELTSYIPSSTGVITRAADRAFATDIELPDTERGTLRAIATIDGRGDRRVACLLGDASELCLARAGGTGAAITDDTVVIGGPWPNATREELIATWAPGELALSSGDELFRASANVPVGFVGATFGHRETTSLDGHLERVTYWPERVAGF